MPSLQQLPDLASLDQLPFYLNQAGMNQINMANQFNQTGLQQNQAELEAKGLQNLFDRQNNPLRLRERELANEGASLDNTIKGVQARDATALEQDNRALKRQKALEGLDERKLKQLQTQAEMFLMEAARDGDEAKGKKAQTMLDASWAEITRRRKAADELEKAKAMGFSRQEVARINQAGATGREEMGIDAGKYKRGAASKSLMDYYNSSKTPTETAERALMIARSLESQGDAEGAAQWRQTALEARQREAETIANKGLATPGVDAAAVANLPPKARPSAGAGMPTPAQNSGVMWIGSPAKIAADIASLPPDAREAAQAQYQAQLAGQGQPAAPAAPKAPNLTLSEVQKMYPGKDPETLKKLFKLKFGVDLQ